MLQWVWWHAPGNAIIAKILTLYLPRGYVTCLPKQQANSEDWLWIVACSYKTVNCIIFPTLFHQFYWWKYLFRFYGQSVVDSYFLTFVSSLLNVYVSSVSLQKVSDSVTSSESGKNAPHNTTFRENHKPAKKHWYQFIFAVRMCYERNSFLSFSLTQREKQIQWSLENWNISSIYP